MRGSLLARRRAGAAPVAAARWPRRRRDRRCRRHRLRGRASPRRGGARRAGARRARGSRRARAAATAASRCAAARRDTTSRARRTDASRRAGSGAGPSAPRPHGGLAGDALRRPGSFRLAADDEERDEIRLEYEALRDDGLDAEWLDDLPGTSQGRFTGGIRTRRRHDAAGALGAPPRGARGRGGAEIREHDRVDDLEALDADRVLVATDGYGHGLVPEARRGDLADARAGDRQRAARPRALRPAALRAAGLRLLAAAARRARAPRRASATSRSSTS